MLIPLAYGLIAGFAFWFLLEGLQRVLGSRGPAAAAGPGDDTVLDSLMPSGAGVTARAYATATSRLHGAARTRA